MATGFDAATCAGTEGQPAAIVAATTQPKAGAFGDHRSSRAPNDAVSMSADVSTSGSLPGGARTNSRRDPLYFAAVRPSSVAPLALLLCSCFFDIAPVPEPLLGEVITFGDDWRYRSGTADADWPTLAYDDAAWTAGPAPLGYGDCAVATVLDNNCPPGDCNTPETYNCLGQHVTYYFRRTIEVPADRIAAKLRFEVLVDDGAAFYVDGAEVQRLRLPAGTITSAIVATESVSGDEETTAETFLVEGLRLTAGTHVIAVEVHQEGPGTDVFFDVAVTAE